MGLFSFYNARKPQGFNYKPVFHDPRKEALEERVSKAKKELGLDIPDEEYRPNIKGSLANQTNHLKRRIESPEKSSSRTTTILAVILILLTVTFYYVYLR